MTMMIEIIMIKNYTCMSNGNIKCRPLILNNVDLNKQKNKKEKKTGGHIQVAHADNNDKNSKQNEIKNK